MSNSAIKDYINRSNMYMQRYKRGMYLRNKHTNDIFKITRRRTSLGCVYVKMLNKPDQIEVKGLFHISDLLAHFELLNDTEAILYAK